MHRTPLMAASAAIAFGAGFQSSDFLKLRSVGVVQFSPDGLRIAYTVIRNDGPGRPFPQIWVMTLSGRQTISLSSGDDSSSNPVWSPDGQWIAFQGKTGKSSGLFIVHPDGSSRKFLTAMDVTNGPLPTTGATIAWSPESKRIAYVSAQPGPESGNVMGDPVVIKNYFYKPMDKEGETKFNDNKRLHLFIADIASGKTEQITTGVNHEHSIEWSPRGNEIAYVSNREPDNTDQFLNYVLFARNLSSGEDRRLTTSENAAFRPHFAPDGKLIAFESNKRGLNGLEPAMENTHVWVMNADGTHLRALTESMDHRHQQATWAPDGRSMLFMVSQSGNVHLQRMPLAGGNPVPVIEGLGSVIGYSCHGDQIAYSWETPGDQAQLYVKTGTGPGTRLTDLNHDLLQDKEAARVESFTFVSNDHKWNVEAFLTYPADFQEDHKYPLVVTIHGGPHWQQGPAYNPKNQAYATHGIATLMVNYRGSIGYGQAFTDAVFRNQNGDEAQDILYGVNAAMRRHLWIDRDRLGIEGISYGGQLGAWLVTQTNMFKAAVLTAAVTNLVSFTYTTNFRQYEQVQWGERPHQGNLIDLLWERSALRNAPRVRTPTLLIHGEDDSDVPIGESEQFYMALREVNTDSVMVRYPREGHGIHEAKHFVDTIDRSLEWYKRYFAAR